MNMFSCLREKSKIDFRIFSTRRYYSLAGSLGLSFAFIWFAFSNTDSSKIQTGFEAVFQDSTCSPKVEVVVHNTICGQNNGMITFFFEDDPLQTHIEFSLDGGRIFPLNVEDNIGSAGFQNLAAGNYQVVARWGNDQCPVDLGTVSIINEGPVNCCADLTNPGTTVCNERTASNTLSCQDDVEYGIWLQLRGITNFYSVETSQFIEFENGTARYTANISNTTNPAFRFKFDAVFSGRTSVGTPKERICSPSSDFSDFYYYEDVRGNIKGLDGLQGACIAFVKDGAPFQIGSGADILSMAPNQFGGSGWLRATILTQPFTGPKLSLFSPRADINLMLSGTSCSACTDIFQVDLQTDLSFCAGDSTKIFTNVSGGTAPFAYKWNNGAETPEISIDPTVDGIYSVTVTDALGCITENQIELDGAPAFTAFLDKNDANCDNEDGTATMVVLGGTPPYSYRWSNGDTTASVTNLAVGSYFVFVSDQNGCSVALSFEILEKAGPTIEEIQKENTTCGESNGVASAIILGGTPPYSFLWNNGATIPTILDVDAGTYTLTVTDANGCTANGSVVIQESEIFTVNIGRDTTICTLDSVRLLPMLTGDFDGATFLWNTGQTSSSITVSPQVLTEYFVTVENNDGCVVTSNIVTVTPDPELCVLPCEITITEVEKICSDNGTPDDGSDDSFVARLLIEGVGTSSGWMVGNGITGTYGEVADFGPFFIAGGNIRLTFRDMEQTDCTNEIIIVPPGQCSEGVMPPLVSCAFETGDTTSFTITDLNNCTANLTIPVPGIQIVSPNCDVLQLTTFVFDSEGNTVAIIRNNNSRLIRDIQIGSYEVLYEIQDNCGNLVRKFCYFSVVEAEAPEAVCFPMIDLFLSDTNIVTIPGYILDIGSSDNCGIMNIEFRRGLIRDSINCDSLELPMFTEWTTDFLSFTCCDVNDTVDVQMRVTDFSGNVNICTSKVHVLDTFIPICADLPDTTVRCETLPANFDPLDLNFLQENFGTGFVIDNCEAVSIELEPVISFTDSCNFTITRRFFARDRGGNESGVCSQDIRVTDGSMPVLGMVRGTVYTMAQHGIQGVEMGLSGGRVSKNVTSTTGRYEFPDLSMNQKYVVTPYLDNNHRQGVTTLDLIRLHQFLLGQIQLENPYWMIAADVNNSGAVSTLDLLDLRKLVLGEIDRFPKNTSWRFVDANYDFKEPKNPWFEPYPQSIDAVLDSRPFIRADFIGIKIGDIDQYISPNEDKTVTIRNSGSDAVNLILEDKFLLANQTYSIPVFLDQMNGIIGFQSGFSLNSNLIDIIEVEEGILKEEHFSLSGRKNGLISFSWHDLNEAFEEDAASPLFHLIVSPRQNTKLAQVLASTDAVLQPEAYNFQGDILPIGIKFIPEAEHPEFFELFQNHPNPFTDETQIGLYLPEAGKARLEIRDVTGKICEIIERDFERGYQEITFGKHHLSAGIYFYSLRFGKYSATKRLIIN